MGSSEKGCHKHSLFIKIQSVHWAHSNHMERKLGRPLSAPKILSYPSKQEDLSHGCVRKGRDQLKTKYFHKAKMVTNFKAAHMSARFTTGKTLIRDQG